MYKEEKLINGVWSWRGTPDGEWIAFTIEQLSAKYVELKAISFDHELTADAAIEEINRLKHLG